MFLSFILTIINANSFLLSYLIISHLIITISYLIITISYLIISIKYQIFNKVINDDNDIDSSDYNESI
jgi:hypothetical protein